MTLRAHGGGAIFAEHHPGEQPAVLGLHGWGRNRSDLLGLLKSTGHAAVSVDLPGFGASPAPPVPWSASDYATAVAEQVLRDLCCGPLVVVGHSFGGRVAVCLAAQRPEMVRALVLMGVPLLRRAAPTRPSLSYRLTRTAARLRLLSPERLERARQRRGSRDYRLAQGVMRDVLVRVVNEDYRGELARLRCPVTLIWGEQDDVVPLSLAEEAAALASGDSRVRPISGAGHDPHRDAPGEVAEALSGCLKNWS